MKEEIRRRIEEMMDLEAKKTFQHFERIYRTEWAKEAISKMSITSYEKPEIEISKNENGITKGDWVEIVNYRNSELNGIVGYVEDISPNRRNYQFRAVKTKDSRPARGLSWFLENEVKKLPFELSGRDLDDLIDWALDTGDKEYFNSLVKLKNSVDKPVDIVDK